MTAVQVEDAKERMRLCEAVLRALPEWFGIEAAIDHYVEAVVSLPSFAIGEEGFLALKLHTPAAAEVHVLGVLPGRHGQRLGAALVEGGEGYLRARGVEYLQVKTLGRAVASERALRTHARLLSVAWVRPARGDPRAVGRQQPVPDHGEAALMTRSGAVRR